MRLARLSKSLNLSEIEELFSFVSLPFYVLELEISLSLSGIFWTSLEKNYFLMENVWTEYLAEVLRVAGSHSVNPLIYGILDKNLLTFWKLCRKK